MERELTISIFKVSFSVSVYKRQFLDFAIDGHIFYKRVYKYEVYGVMIGGRVAIFMNYTSKLIVNSTAREGRPYSS